MRLFTKMKSKEIKSKVNIREIEKGFLIEITDGIINPTYAVTKDELRQIVLQGMEILYGNQVYGSGKERKTLMFILESPPKKKEK